MVNIDGLIDTIKQRPGMYLGRNSVSYLRVFLDGYFLALRDNGITTDIYPPFWFFHEWVAHYYGWSSSVAGWCNIILKENNQDEVKSLNVFFELYKQFREIKPISIRKAIILDKALEFHYSDKCKSKRLVGYDLENLEPIYRRPTEVCIVELSQNFGFMYFVLDNGVIEINRGILKNEEQVKKVIKELFGENLIWESIDGSLFSEFMDNYRL